MSKSRNRKWFDHDEEYEYDAKRKRFEDRRSNKRRKQALKTKNWDELERLEDEG